MARTKTVYVCQTCGSQSPKWQGKCSDCESWNSFIEEEQVEVRYVNPTKIVHKPILLEQASSEINRVATMSELDRVLGGGMVQGSLILLGGAPGIGKSTLLLQVAAQASERHQVLYVSGEESEGQTKLRAHRLGLPSSQLHILHEINLESIVHHLESLKPSIAVIDSIQTLYKNDVSSAPGSVAQVRECAGELLRLCKNSEITIILVGHITKEGSIAGPRVLEHIVDTVLYLEGESHQAHRVLRAFKNRFGSTQEVGIFEMTGTGLVGVANPSQIFLQSFTDSPGCVVVPVLEGQRPLLIELQALVSRSWYGIPKRTSTGVDFNRLAIILAILEKRYKMKLGQSDVYINVVGAIKIKEPAADLAMAMAITSNEKEKGFPMDCIAFGEVGLGGEVRPVPFAEERVREAAHLGFKRALIPKANLPLRGRLENFELIGVSNLAEAMNIF